MNSAEFIVAAEFCSIHRVELSFIRELRQSGLIETTIRDGSILLASEDLPALEKFVRWHYELAINFEGMEALSHLLRRMDTLQEENRVLRNRLLGFQGKESGHAQPAEEI